MTSEKLESFKISDTRKPFVASHGKNAGAESPAETPTVGFRRIESMIESESDEQAFGVLGSIKSRLQAFASEATTNRDKTAAKKAIVAVDHVLNLVDFLYKTKDSMVSDNPARHPTP